MIFEISMLAYNMTMELKTKHIGRITVIELTGRMTVDNIYSLTKSIEKNVFAFAGKIEDPSAKCNSRVILDMAGVEASHGPIPGLGEQRDAILAEIGYDAGQIARLRTAGVC